MGIKFNADEVFEIAGQIERNGAQFYRKAAGGTLTADANKLLNGLADIEVEHEKSFATMRSNLSDQDKTPTVFDPDNESVLYLRAFADGQVFDLKSDPAASLTGKESLSDILQKALWLEKESVVFYSGVKEVVPAHLGSAWVEKIIREELGHIALLSGQLRKAG